MCGIAGIWSRDQTADRIAAELRQAVSVLRHRGPDDEGTWFDDSGLGLGHTRLSILDLSALGHQPMISDDGRFVIVYNGEIYNFAEIRERLLAAGHSFSGSGDTEVILHAFREWGPDAVSQFIGMFAIALWDSRDKTLQLVRDRIGVKPLYFGWDGRTLCFGSELKAIRAFSHWTPEIDATSVGEFLQYGYIAGDRTIYKNTYKLKPGHRLTLRKGESPTVEPYWSIVDSLNSPLSGSDADLEADLEKLLIDAIRYRMVSDVPVGVFLSGGVDSSLVTAILAKHHDHAIRSFTIGFAESGHNESVWAKKVAEHCGTNHTEYILGVNEALEIAKDWGTLFDEPFGDSSGIPTLLVSRLAGQEVKVVLSADGGDELFSGYNAYTGILERMAKLDRLPSWLARTASGSLGLISPRTFESALGALPIGSPRRGAALRKLYRVKSMLGEPTVANMMDLDVSYWRPADIARLTGDYERVRPGADSYPGTRADQISLWDFHHYLPEDVLTKVDRTTMAVSIEGRDPLLDHRLAEFAFRLPLHLRRGSLGPKHLLKSVLYRYVPRSLVDRPKQGFAIPLENWLRTDLKGLVHDFLSPARIRDAGIMDSDMTRELVENFYAGDSLVTTRLWFLLAFEMWRQEWG